MARNVEIKARIDSLTEIVSAVVILGADGPIEMRQEHTYFHGENGRLKLREFSEVSGELIFYSRTDLAGPKGSFYLRSPTAEPRTLKDLLSASNRVLGVVRKVQLLFRIGRTRIHLDRVEGLGEFLELEVVLEHDEEPESGVHDAELLLKKLGIGRSQLVEGSYLDLLTNPNHRRLE